MTKAVTTRLSLLLPVVVAAVIFTTACSSTPVAAADPVIQEREQRARQEREAKDRERAQVRSDLSAAESERNVLASRLELLTATSGVQQVSFAKYQQAIQEQEIAVKAFMMDHKMAVAAILAGVAGPAAAMDKSLSDDARTVAGIAGGLAAIWAIGNMKEVLQVADALVQADSRMKDLKAASERAQLDRQNAESEIQAVRARMNDSDRKISELRTSLSAL